jgi:predicted RNase H-like HicB family nuclease
MTTSFEEAEEGGYIGYVAELPGEYSRRNLEESGKTLPKPFN